MKRRIIAALMALCLCIGLLPATALAAGNLENLSITKHVKRENQVAWRDTTDASVGTTVQYQIVIENSGNSPESIEITDDFWGKRVNSVQYSVEEFQFNHLLDFGYEEIERNDAADVSDGSLTVTIPAKYRYGIDYNGRCTITYSYVVKESDANLYRENDLTNTASITGGRTDSATVSVQPLDELGNNSEIHTMYLEAIRNKVRDAYDLTDSAEITIRRIYVHGTDTVAGGEGWTQYITHEDDTTWNLSIEGTNAPGDNWWNTLNSNRIVYPDTIDVIEICADTPEGVSSEGKYVRVQVDADHLRNTILRDGGKHITELYLKFDLKFDANGVEGLTVPETQIVEYNTTAAEPTTNIEVEWYTDAACTDKWDFTADRVFRDTTLYAKTVESTTDYNITDFSKELVRSAPVDVTGIPSDVKYPAEGTTVEVPESGSVTLLYKFTVTGDVSAAYTITDPYVTVVSGELTGKLETTTEEIYVTKTFYASDVQNGVLTNTATITAGADTEINDEDPGDNTATVPAVVKPDGPTDTELKAAFDGKIQVVCANAHDTIPYGLDDVQGGYDTAASAVEKVDGSWVYKVKINTTPFLIAYNGDSGEERHQLVDTSETQIEAALIWNAETETWSLSTPDPVVIDVICINPDVDAIQVVMSDGVQALYDNMTGGTKWIHTNFTEPQGNLADIYEYYEMGENGFIYDIFGISENEIASVTMGTWTLLGGSNEQYKFLMNQDNGTLAQVEVSYTWTEGLGGPYYTMVLYCQLVSEQDDTPDGPTDDQITDSEGILANAINLTCSNTNVSHGSKSTSIQPNDGGQHNSYEIGSVTSNNDGTYSCTITVKPVAAYGTAYGTVDGYPHTLVNNQANQTIELIWRDAATGWRPATANYAVTFNVTCNAGVDVDPPYELIYNHNDGVNVTVDETSYPSSTDPVTLSTNIVTDTDTDGVTFVGWTEGPNSYTKTSPATSDPTTGDNAVEIKETVIFGNADITVYAVWAKDEDNDNIPDYEDGEYTVTASAPNGNGTIAPALSLVSAGDDVTFTINATTANYVVDYITVKIGDGTADVVYSNNDAANPFGSGGKSGTWTLADVSSNSEVNVYFAEDADSDGVPDDPSYWTITATAGSNGSISPSGTVFVANGQSQQFTFSPSGGYRVNNVTVDGSAVNPANNSYTIPIVTSNRTIHVTFTTTGGGTTTPDPGTGGSESKPYLRFDSNGGTEFDPIDENGRDFSINVYDDDHYGTHIPTRPGYRFTGWYITNTLRTRIDEDEILRVTSYRTVFAGWEETSVPSMLNGDDHYAYIQGYSDGTVRPNANITRAQVATIFFRLLDEDVRDDNLTTYNTFPDVDEDYWANTAISTMASLGVINGRNSGLFDPDAYITRAEFAAICARFDDSGVDGITTFTDTVGHWAEDEISRAAALGWIQGYSDGTFRPNQYITRAQAVTMINRVLCRLPEDTDDLLSGMNTWTDCHEDDWFYLAIQEATNSHDFVAKDRVYESWTDLNRAPDWSRYE